WLARGIHVVTACKLGQGGSLRRWRAIRDAAEAGGTRYGDSATVGAGLPLLRTIRALRAGGDRIHGIAGVLSGSLAWLFDAYDGTRPFAACVRQAQAAGYTEPDPRDDLSGEDVRRKLLILARAAGFELESDAVRVESLAGASDDALRDRLAAARASGGRLAFVARLQAGVASARLEVLPPDDPLAPRRRPRHRPRHRQPRRPLVGPLRRPATGDPGPRRRRRNHRRRPPRRCADPVVAALVGARLARDRGQGPLPQSRRKRRSYSQHSMTLTARPPREVSLYLSRMSRPVSRMVLMTLSRLTLCLPSPRSAMRAALIAFTEPMALRSMHGICTNPPIGSQVRPRLCSMPISAAFSTCDMLAPSAAARPPAAIEQATPTSPWQPTSAPLIEAFSL